MIGVEATPVKVESPLFDPKSVLYCVVGSLGVFVEVSEENNERPASNLLKRARSVTRAWSSRKRHVVEEVLVRVRHCSVW